MYESLSFEFDVRTNILSHTKVDYSRYVIEDYFNSNADILQVKCFALDKGEVVAYGSASIYSSKYLERGCGCNFNSNKHRAFWIDCVRSLKQRKGYGTKIIKMLEKILLEYQDRADEGALQNIYVITKYTNHNFYFENGYDEINYVSGDDFDDYCDFKSGSTSLNIYAKPIGAHLDTDIYVFDSNNITIESFEQAVSSNRKELCNLTIDQLVFFLTEYFNNIMYYTKEECLECLSNMSIPPETKTILIQKLNI